MNKYSDSKIYMIRDRTNNNCYIGSTFNKLCLRKAIHKYHYKLYTQNRFHYLSSFDIMITNLFYWNLTHAILNNKCMKERNFTYLII